MAVTAQARVLGPTDGREGFLGSIGVRFMVDGETTGETFSLVEHPMSARALAAPLHRHNREDEYSYVIEGRMGAILGDQVLEAGPGDLVFKPRGEGTRSGTPGPRSHRRLRLSTDGWAPLRRLLERRLHRDLDVALQSA